MEIAIKNLDGADSVLSVSDDFLNRPYNEVLVHQVLTAYLAKQRVGSKAQKTRSEVSGGGKKPWRQKGSGRARAGTIRSPIWRAGGVNFASKPRDYDKKVNKKAYRAAVSVVLSELNRQSRLDVLKELTVSDGCKTKSFVDRYQSVTASEKFGRTYFIDSDLDLNLVLASRNIPQVRLSSVSDLRFDDLIQSDKVVMSERALKLLFGANDEK